MVEAHGQPPRADDGPASLHHFGDDRILRAPTALHPGGDPFVVVHDGQSGIFRRDAKEKVQRAQLGEDVAEPRERGADRALRTQ